MYTRALPPPATSFILLGPRATGKTTWLRTHWPDATWFDLLDEGLYQQLLRSPAQFSDQLRTCAPGSWVVIDEVQRLPALLNDVHRFIEQGKLRFALSGSSARRLRRVGVNLLAGRLLPKLMYPLMPNEMSDAFVLEDALTVGTLPIVTASTTPAETLHAYVQMYLKEEIQAEAIVRNLPGFARFLPIAATVHGQTINTSNIARESQVARNTVEGFVEILEDTLMAFRLPAFEAKLRIRERKHPKLFWADAGIVRAARGNRGPVSSEERGHLFEGWLANVLRFARDTFSAFDDMWYWAPAEATQTEVDFLLRRNDKFIAIEAKSSTVLDSRFFEGLRAIEPLPGLVKRLVVYPGTTRRLTEEGIEIWPAADFANHICADNFFEKVTNAET